MSLLEQKKDYSKRGAFDELYTPDEAVNMIIRYIPNDVKVIWECTAIKDSRIVKVLRDNGYKVITSHIEDGQDFF
jgi:spore maturation protein CgeB